MPGVNGIDPTKKSEVIIDEQVLSEPAQVKKENVSTFGNEIVNDIDKGVALQHAEGDEPMAEPQEPDEEYYTSYGKASRYVEAHEEELRQKIKENGSFEYSDSKGTKLTFTVDEDDVLHVHVEYKKQDFGSAKMMNRVLGETLVEEAKVRKNIFGKEVVDKHVIWVREYGYEPGPGVVRKDIESFGHASEERKAEYEQVIDDMALTNNKLRGKHKSELKKRANDATDKMEGMIKEDLGFTDEKDVKNALNDQKAHAKVKYTNAHLTRSEYKAAYKELKKQQKEILQKDVIDESDLDVLRQRETLVGQGTFDGWITRRNIRNKGITTPDQAKDKAVKIASGDNTLTYEEAVRERDHYNGLNKKQSKRLTKAVGMQYARSSENDIKVITTVASLLAVGAKVADELLSDRDMKLKTLIIEAFDSANSMSESHATANALADGYFKITPTEDGNWLLTLYKEVTETVNGEEVTHDIVNSSQVISSANLAELAINFSASANAEATAEASAEAKAALEAIVNNILKDGGYNGIKGAKDALIGYMLGLLPGLADIISFEGGRNARTFVQTATEQYYNGEDPAQEEPVIKEYDFAINTPKPCDEEEPPVAPPQQPPVENTPEEEEHCDCEETVKFTLPKATRNEDGTVNRIEFYEIMQCFLKPDGTKMNAKELKEFIKAYREAKFADLENPQAGYYKAGREHEICKEFNGYILNEDMLKNLKPKARKIGGKTFGITGADKPC